MIARVWHGWTTPENADAYEELLRSEIFPGIEAKGVAGYRGIRLLRRVIGDGDGDGDGEGAEVEFVTMMFFDSFDDVKAFAGEDYEAAYVPAAARQVLARFDERSIHFELRRSLDY